MECEIATHILNVPKGMRRRAGTQFVVELPQCMGRDVWLATLHDRLFARSAQSNVVVLVDTPVEAPADCG